MSGFRRFDIVERSPSCFLKETSIFAPPKSLLLNPCFLSFSTVEDELDHALDLLYLCHPAPVLFNEFETVTDVIQFRGAPFSSTTRRVSRRVGLGELYLQKLCDRVSDLELGFERLLVEQKARKNRIGERKYTCTTEIASPDTDRKYKWAAESKDGKDENKGLEKSYKWTARIKGKDGECSPLERTYTVKVSGGPGGSESEEETDVKKKKEKKKGEKLKGKSKPAGSAARIIEIEEPYDHGGIVLRQVFAKRMEKRKGKLKQLLPEDAAALIQMSFRAYMIRRSQALRALRELAIAKTKLREMRALFNNFSYRHRLSRDAEESQRFSEKIIVLLLTVDAIEGVDLMVRASKKFIVDELEAMLDVVDPQPPGKSRSVGRRKFDMPDGVINKELAESVAQVVRMLDEEPTDSETFEACL